MAATRRSDIIVPEILAEGMKGAFAGMNLLQGTGVVTVNPTLRAGKKEVNDQIKIPKFNTIGDMQDIPEGGAASVQSLTQGSELATVEHAAIAIGIGQWAQIAGADDPYAEARRQIVIAVKRKLDAKLIAKARTTTLILNRYDNADASLNGTLNYDMGADAMALFGDESEEGDFVLWGVHSKVKTDLRKTKDSTGRSLLSDQQGKLSMFMGVPVAQSDRLTPSSDTPPKYETLLGKRGSLAAWINPDMGIQEDRDILADDVVMAFHLYYCVHLYLRAPNSTYCGMAKVQHK
jgi:hypothetical protein